MVLSFSIPLNTPAAQMCISLSVMSYLFSWMVGVGKNNSLRTLDYLRWEFWDCGAYFQVCFEDISLEIIDFNFMAVAVS